VITRHTPRLTLAALLTLLACGPKPAPTATPEAPAEPAGPPVRAVPGPLPAPAFTMPTVQEGTLSNGLRVRVVTNSEVPLWDARLLFKVGSYADPKGKEGLHAATLAMLDEGAGGKDAETIARTLKLLGGSLSAGGSSDSASISVSGPKRNLGKLLDLWADAIQRPDFPEEEWKLMSTRWIAALEADAENPTSIASKVLDRVVWGEAYDGRAPTKQSYTAIRTSDMKSHRKNYLGPSNATLLIGGDLTLEEVLPLLEARLGTWRNPAKAPPSPGAVPKPIPSVPTLYVVDKPGAAQSVLTSYLPTGTRTDPDYYALYMGNTVLGGAFTARMNMNLREDKGYTYGARCAFTYGHGPGLWTCSASVATGVTAPALSELRNELTQIVGERPVTDEELRFFTSFRVNSFQTDYETPSSLLGQLSTMWVFDLPADWLTAYLPSVKAQTREQVQAALAAHLKTQQLSYVVVGDMSVVRADLEALGMPIVPLDRDGNRLK
jgi:zinc protease